jgi:hypothetical protein
LEVDLLIWPHQGWAPKCNARRVCKMGAQMQCKARPQVGRPNAKQGTSASWAPQRTSATQTQGTSTSWVPQRTSATQTQGTSASWAPQRNARHVRKMGTQTQRKASSQDGRPNEKLIRNENIHTREHSTKRRAGGWIRTNFGLEVDFLIRPHQGWAPQRNARHVRKMGTQTQRKARPQVGRPNAKQGTSASWAPQCTSATQTQGTSASWVPQRNARHVRKMGAQTQRKASSQDGRPNEKLIRNENVHTREH